MYTLNLELPQSLASMRIGEIFNDFERSLKQSSRVANHWFTFSKFMPEFLADLARVLTNEEIKHKVLAILNEELGSDIGAKPHYLLYSDALEKIGINTRQIDVKSIETFKSEFIHLKNTCGDLNPLVAGISLGLEIIAEKNIEYLLKYSAFDDESERKLKLTPFFKIHLINEKEHIMKCISNYELIATSADNENIFKIGMKTGLDFWKNFWMEALYETPLSH